MGKFFLDISVKITHNHHIENCTNRGVARTIFLKSEHKMIDERILQGAA